jgi:hypothetical protein
MKKRSKYKPRPVLANPVAYVMESLTPLSARRSLLVDLKIKNHAAMTALTQGVANRNQMDVLIAMSNMIEALWRLGFGAEYEAIMKEGRQAVFDVCRRGLSIGRFVLRGPEMMALNLLMELHDAQMEVITLRDLERGIELVRKHAKPGHAQVIRV